MASPTDHISMALFCDFENVALGVRDAKYDRFDIKPVLERLLLKGSIVVKKAYCDWERYKGFKAAMHEANFELIEIPHVRQSGKNSADIRLVVDALDLCYTKSHVNTFVIISGDSDFSPLVSKLRENAKQVIGVGVKQSTSDLLIANCDEFIFYDDLVRESQRAQARRQPADAAPQARRSPEEERHRKEALESRRTQGIELAVETFDALVAERGDSGKIWASVLKEAIKRRKPDFNEAYYGFRAFGNLLEEAQQRGLLEFGRDEKSGAYVFRSHGNAGSAPVQPERPVGSYFRQDTSPSLKEPGADNQEPRQRGRGGRSRNASEVLPHELPPALEADANARPGDDLPAGEFHRDHASPQAFHEPVDAPQERPMGSYFRQPPPAAQPSAEAPEPAPLAEPPPAPAPAPARGRGRSRKPALPAADAATPSAAPVGQMEPAASASAASTLPLAATDTGPDQPPKAPARPRRTRKPPENSASQ